MNDWLIDENQDLQIKNGDFVIDNATLQNQYLLVVSNKGEFKQHPKVGAGINGYLLDDEQAGMLREIRYQFENDGMAVNRLEYKNEKLKLNAGYKS